MSASIWTVLRASSVCWLAGPATGLIAAEADLATRATNQLGLELLRGAASGDARANQLFSPYSIQLALAMTYAGADGATHREMASVLHFSDDEAALQKSFAELRTRLESAVARSEMFAKNADERERSRGSLFGRRSGASSAPPESPPTEAVKLAVANRLFGQSGFRYEDAFLRATREGYGAPLEERDFIRDVEPSRRAINDWVETQTQKKIHELIPPNGVNARTRLVLVNAVYLKAPWSERFERRWTKDDSFFSAEGEAWKIATMQQTTSYGYARTDRYTAVTMRYHGWGLLFTIVLPHERNGLPGLLERVTADELRGLAAIPARKVSLFLPKFRMEPPTLALGASLKRLGLKTAFDEPRGSANFARMAPRRPNDYLAMAEVFHKTFIALDEEGTEAAAATAVTMLMAGSAAPQREEPPPEVHVDHPFLFAIQEAASGACLFLGVVNDPR